MAETSPRVNAARLSAYVGKTVRLPCKVVSKQGDTAIVEASDNAQVQVRIPAGASALTDTFVEIIGNVSDAGSLKMFSCVNMGEELDMKLVNDTIELTHDPRFNHVFFPTS